jgi:VCBS repeat-containing protein
MSSRSCLPARFLAHAQKFVPGIGPMKKKPNRAAARRRFLGMEALESRSMLTGNVNAFLSGGTLHINGDSDANEIIVEQSAANSFTISSRDGSTTINGQSSAVTIDQVTRDLMMALNGGDDVVEMSGTSDSVITVPGNLWVNTGSGDDQVILNAVHAKQLHVDLGAGADTATVGDTSGITITQQAIIMGRDGADHINVANSQFHNYLTVDAGSGNDDITIQGSTVRKTSLVKAGSGSDSYHRNDNHGKIKFRSVEHLDRNVTSAAPVAPTASDDTASVVRGGTTSINVASNDTTADSTSLNLASIVITQAPTNGTATTNSDGTVSYTNNGAAATSDTFQYTIKDQDGTVSNVATVTITVTNSLTAVNDTASVTEDASPNTTTGNVLTNDTGAIGTATVSAVNGSASSVGTVISGQFGTFQINSDGSYTYTLDNGNATVNALTDGQTLTDSMAYTASAGNETSTATLTVTIQGHTDTSFNAVDDTASVTEDSSTNTATGNVLTNDTNAAGSTSVTAVNSSASNVGTTISGQFGTFQVNSDGSYTYTLDNSNTTVNALSDGQTLTDSMSYTASDGTTSSTATLKITIQGHTDTSFTAVGDTASVTEDASPNTATGNVLSNDTNAAGSTSVTAMNGSSGNVGTVISGQFGTFQINSDGSYTYTLDNSNATVNALNDGQTLTDSMGYTASDGTTSSSATLTVTIQGHTDVTFTAVDDAANVTEDASPNTTTGNVLSNDTNAAGSTSVSAVNGSSGNVGSDVASTFGTFHINSDGSYTYTLDNSNATVNALNDGQTLTDSMGYTASDGTTSSSATLTVTILGHTD